MSASCRPNGSKDRIWIKSGTSGSAQTGEHDRTRLSHVVLVKIMTVLGDVLSRRRRHDNRHPVREESL